MALKRIISKDVYEKLTAEMKVLYVASGDDYALDVEASGSDEDPKELKRALDRERQEAKDAKKALKELQDSLEEGTTIDAKKKGDIETLEKSWNEKNRKLIDEHNAKVEKLHSYIKTTLLDNAAKEISAIATSPSLLVPHAKARLTVDLDGDTPVVRVLDKDGKPSASTIDDLKKEFVANKDFSSIIVASKASGGAAKVNEQKPGSASNSSTDKPVMLTKLTPQEMAARITEAKQAQNNT